MVLGRKKSSDKDTAKLKKKFDDIEKALQLLDRYAGTGVGDKRNLKIVQALLKKIGKDRASLIRALK